MSSKISSRPTLWSILAALAGAAACAAEPPVGEQDLAASAAYRAQVKKGVLTITGGAESSRLALRLRAGSPALLDIDVGDDGTADFSFDRSTFDKILIDAGGGDDVVRMDESNGIFTQEELVTLHGGSGNDTLLGGAGAETIFGEAGNDVVDAGGGADHVFLGDDGDTFAWSPGQGSDVVDGGAGADVLTFTGAEAADQIDLSSFAGRLRLARDLEGVVLDVAAVERVDIAAAGGSDRVTVNDLAGSGVTRVNVDLATTVSLFNEDAVIVSGAATITVAREANAVVASGPAASVGVTSGDFGGRLVANGGGRLVIQGTDAGEAWHVLERDGMSTVNISNFGIEVAAGNSTTLRLEGRGGGDFLEAFRVPAGLALELDGGDGRDQLIGSPQADLLLGGNDGDLVDGGGGDDVVLLGPGDDRFTWSPGEGSAVVDGEDGNDVLVFDGSDLRERIELRPSGDRIRIDHSIDATGTDIGGFEVLDIHPFDSDDLVFIPDLTGTPVREVFVDLSGRSGSPDGITDQVIVAGTEAADLIGVAATLGEIAVSGLNPAVFIVGEEPADLLAIHGLGGDDTFAVGADVAGLIFLSTAQE